MLKPTICVHSVTEITGQMLKKLGVRAILLDVDNTLASYSAKEPLPGTREWAAGLQAEGYGVYIVSNNFHDRVSKIAEKFGLPFVSFALKPLPVGFKKARRAMGFKSRECLVVGDQIFTDILGAGLGGMPSVLVDPVELEDGLSFKIRRILEKPIRKRLLK